MVLQKEDIWERLKTESTWVTNTRTELFAAAVPEHQFRYVVGIWISGNMQTTRTIQFEKLDEDPSDPHVDANFTMKWSPIPVAPADFRQIPKGSYSITDPIVTFEGGTSLYGKTDGVVAGVSLNVTVDYWDWDV